MAFKWGKKKRQRKKTPFLDPFTNIFFHFFVKLVFFIFFFLFYFPNISKEIQLSFTLDIHMISVLINSPHVVKIYIFHQKWKKKKNPCEMLINQLSDRICVRACHQYAWQIDNLWSATNLKSDKHIQCNQNPVKTNI